MTTRPEIGIDFLLSGSKLSMEEAMLRRLAEVSCHRKELLELLDVLVECQAEVFLLEWFKTHGAELMASVTTPLPVTESELPILPAPPKSVSGERFRANLKRLLESA